MPRIPRRWARAEQAAPPEAQHAAGPTPTDPQQAPHDAQDAQPSSGDPVAAPSPVQAQAGGEAPTVEAGAVAPAGTPSEQPAAPADARPRFRERTRMRRRLRYLRRLRELAFRDLGGLVFDLHRFGRERGDLVAQKLETLGEIDRELRTLEVALGDRRDVVELREPGIAACPRCETLHDTSAQFCPGCGTSLRGADGRDEAARDETPAGEQPQAGEAQPGERQPTATPS